MQPESNVTFWLKPQSVAFLFMLLAVCEVSSCYAGRSLWASALRFGLLLLPKMSAARWPYLPPGRVCDHVLGGNKICPSRCRKRYTRERHCQSVVVLFWPDTVCGFAAIVVSTYLFLGSQSADCELVACLLRPLGDCSCAWASAIHVRAACCVRGCFLLLIRQRGFSDLECQAFKRDLVSGPAWCAECLSEKSKNKVEKNLSYLSPGVIHQVVDGIN
jgi:hypothetical protein